MREKDPYERVARPKGISDLPRYLKELLGGFFARLFYTFGMVWKTGPWILILMVLFAVLTGILPLVGSLISREILNELQRVITERALLEAAGIDYKAAFFGSTVLVLLIFFFSYKLIQNFINRINSAVTRIAGEKVGKRVKLIIMEKSREVDIASFDMPEFYEKLENANREASTRPIHVLSSTFDVVSNGITLISYIMVLATAPGMWWTALVMVAVSVPSAVINFIYKKKHFAYMRRKSKDRRQMNYYADVMVNKDLVKEIRLFGLGDTFIDKYNSVFNRYYDGMKRLIVRETFWLTAVALLSSVVNCVFFAMIAFKVFAGEMQIGDYSLYTGALTSISTAVSKLINVSATVYEGTLFIDNLIAFVKTEPTVVPSAPKPASVERGVPHTIEFQNVSFCYPGSDKKVIEDLNLTLRPGETAVLVGLNGAGKTTFIKLLVRLYDPTEGRILLDGRDIREYDVDELYRLFGIIFQDFGKYAVSVAENIEFGDVSADADRKRVIDAAKASGADAYVMTLPENYDTPLMKIFEFNGTELSGGQWQKIAVARAFYSHSDILILDEPTASLDPLAEQEIFNQFDALRKDKTTIFVSHRLSSAKMATKIIVLENGRLVEEGTHKELMALGGRYFELFTTQASRYAEDEESKPPQRRRP